MTIMTTRTQSRRRVPLVYGPGPGEPQDKRVVELEQRIAKLEQRVVELERELQAQS
jgi:hypothetical protein